MFEKPHAVNFRLKIVDISV